MVENTRRSGEDDDTETTSREEQVDPGLDLGVLHIEAWRYHTSFIQTAVQLDDNLAGAVVIDDFKFTNVSCSTKTNVVRKSGLTSTPRQMQGGIRSDKRVSSLL